MMLHSINEEMKAQGGQVTCQDQTANGWQRWDSNPDIRAPQSMPLTPVPDSSNGFSSNSWKKNKLSRWSAKPDVIVPLPQWPHLLLPSHWPTQPHCTGLVTVPHTRQASSHSRNFHPGWSFSLRHILTEHDKAHSLTAFRSFLECHFVN